MSNKRKHKRKKHFASKKYISIFNPVSKEEIKEIALQVFGSLYYNPD